jgi:hypothetical protein
MPATAVVTSLESITEVYRQGVVVDTYRNRINQDTSGPIISEQEMTDQQLYDHALMSNMIPVRSEYRIISRGYDGTANPPVHVAQVHVFDYDVDTIVSTVTVKAPLHLLPEGFDELTEAEKHEAIIAYGRSIGQVNHADW